MQPGAAEPICAQPPEHSITCGTGREHILIKTLPRKVSTRALSALVTLAYVTRPA